MTVLGDGVVAAMVRRGTTAPSAFDDLGWSHSSGPYEAQGHRFRVRCSDGDLGAHVATLLGALRSDGPPDDHDVVYSLLEYVVDGAAAWASYVDGQRLVHRTSAASAIAMLLWELNRRVIAAASTERVALHAGCVARRDRGVVMAAPMESGKTTLTTGLLRRGLDYLSDEAAVVDPTTLRLSAYPKPLSIDTGSWPLFPELAPVGTAAAVVDDQWHVPATAIRSDNTVGSAAPALLLLPTYVRAGTTRVLPVGPGEMVQALAASTFRFREHPERDLRVLARLVERCRYHRLEVADLDAACDLVLELLESS